MTTDQEVLAVLAEEVGPAAKAFLYRICRQQLHKEPSMLQSEDIDQFASACYMGLKQSLGIPLAEKIKANLLALKK
jgi:hypothetical protein